MKRGNEVAKEVAKTVSVGMGRKGRVPDVKGVPGKVIQLPAGLTFGSRARQSPYDPLLREVETAAPGSGLEFGDPRARASVIIRAKKLGLKVEFAEQDGKLYVRLAAAQDTRTARHDAILALLRLGPSTPIKIASVLREKGDTVADGQIVVAALGQMERNNLVIKLTGAEWGLNPRK